MESKKLFEKYYSRLVRVGIAKAVLCGAIAGFAVDFAIALAAWIAAFNWLWIAIGAGLGVTVLTAVFCYFKFFRPTTKKIAELIDGLGLEERLITMYELERDESYIALRQREDAKEKLSGVKTGALKYNLPRAAIVLVCVFALLGTSMTTVMGLAAEGKIPHGGEIPGLIIPPSPEDFVEISYEVEGGGYIEGEPFQVVLKGENSEEVVAVAEDGWVFYQWDDEFTEPARTELRVEENLVITAVFVEISDGEGEGDGEGGSDAPVEDDQAEDKPGEGEGAQRPSEQPGQQENQHKPDDGTEKNPGNQGNVGGVGATDNNTVVDGKTDYTSEFDYSDLDDLPDEDMPPELKESIGAYYDSLKP